jgi:hypothetical protein
LPVPLLQLLHLPTGLFQVFVSLFFFAIALAALIYVSMRRERTVR